MPQKVAETSSIQYKCIERYSEVKAALTNCARQCVSYMARKFFYSFRYVLTKNNIMSTRKILQTKS